MQGVDLQISPVDKGLTLYQPWASLMGDQEKRFETRHWSTPHRGPIAIHAADDSTPKALGPAIGEVFQQTLIKHGYLDHRISYDYDLRKHLRQSMPFKAITAVGWLVAIFSTESIRDDDFRRRLLDSFGVEDAPNELHFGNYSAGRYAWLVLNVQKLPQPIFVPGNRRIWNISHPDLPLVKQPRQIHPFVGRTGQLILI